MPHVLDRLIILCVIVTAIVSVQSLFFSTILGASW